MSEPDSKRSGLTRRDALRAGAATAGGLAFAGGLLGPALEVAASPAVVGAGPYGPIQGPDANGMLLPAGFSSRIVARTDQEIGPRPYKFHVLPDGMGSFKTDDGGFILVSNSEAPYIRDLLDIGAAALRFDRNFNITDAYPILKNTMVNCAGGVTPWGTWLSCEEIEGGKVFECDPYGKKAAVARPAMGVFKHEACAVDPVGKHVYLTEDLGDGCLYRFTPDRYPDLSSGLLEVAKVADDGHVSWLTVPDPQLLNAAPTPVPTRMQVPDADRFRRGEGMWFDDGTIYFATTQDDRVYALHCESQTLEVLYDGVALGSSSPLHKTDNVTVSPTSGDLYVAEDGDDLQICVVSTEGEVAAFLQLPGVEHENSELTGPVFDPTGHRLYFSSQRMTGGGAIFEVTGPFRRTRDEPVPPDTKKPVVKVRTLGKPTLERLIRSGQPFELKVTDDSPPVEVKARLVTRLMRNNGRRTQDVTIGRLDTKVGKSGVKRIRVKVGKRHAARLRKRDVAQARLIVTATDAEGNSRRTVKPVRFT